MDHRGTSRSTRLDCVAAQTLTSASPEGGNVDPSEVPSCAKDLHFKYEGNLASFSITSAASDLSTLISDYTNGANTFVYGVSYGTTLVERLMHLNTPSVKGYILDSVLPTSGGKFSYFSTADVDCGEVGEYFMGLCTLDAQCKNYFKSVNLSSTLRCVIHKFDKDLNSTCASLVNNDDPELPPSYALRLTLGPLLREASTRTLIPPLVYRLNRCNANNVKVLTHIFKPQDSPEEPTSVSAQWETHFSWLLYYLTVYSGMWESPTPSRAELEARFRNSSITDGGLYLANPLYCAMSKEKSAACNELNVGNYDGDGIIYQRDQYWNKSATLPSDASGLLLSGKLDVQTPHKYAEYLFEALDTDKKELVSFDYAEHEAMYSTLLGDGTNPTFTCGLELLKSYISTNGDLQRLNKPCVSEMPALNLRVPTYQLHNLLSTDGAYDGVYKPELSSS